MSVTVITKDNFEAEVLKCEKTALIDFYADWCGPCRMVSPIVDEISNEHPEYKVCKVNVDREPELAQAFQITSIPALFVIKDGKVVNNALGAMPKDNILDMLK